MKGRRLLLGLGAAVGAAALASTLRPSVSREAPPAAPPRNAEAETLRAEAYVVEEVPVRDVVRTVGTLAANESIDVVAELARRLVEVHVAEGTEVEKGDLLFKLDDADLRARLGELDVRRQLAARTEERQRELLSYDKKALSQQAYDQALAELRMVEAESASVRVTLAKTEIRAPFRARVGLRRVSEGAWITPDTLLTTLQDTSRIKVDFSLPERYAGTVTIGRSFRFQIAGRNEEFEGRVAAIEPAVDALTRSLKVRGVSENPAGVLLPGAFASVEIEIEKEKAGILVPAQAIVPSVSGHGVFVLREGRAVLQEVDIGLRTRQSVEIHRGLKIGDVVLISNLLRLRPGVPVEVDGAG
jgi:membrane fusion protein (multidrug efflux system)